jgi:penicillin-insensitive murein endopeptidase
MVEVQPKDSRGFFMLPQRPEGVGYYVYGTPENGAGQYAHPALLSVLFWVEREWLAVDERKFGIGNISKAGGVPYPKHGTHKDGLQVDCRAVRKDGQRSPVMWADAQYDEDATAKLIAIFLSHPSVKAVLFNGPGIPGVTHWIDHDDHFHVAIRANVK